MTNNAPERIMVAKCHPFKEPDDLYVCHPRLQHPAAVEFVRADVVKELVEALRELIAAQNPEAGEMSRKLALKDARAVLAKLEGGE